MIRSCFSVPFWPSLLAVILLGSCHGFLSVRWSSHACGGESTSAKEPDVDFATDVLPIFRERCFACHGATKQESGFRLDLRKDAIAGGDSGRAWIVGKSGESKLIHLVSGLDADSVMPPEGERLSSKEIGILKGWIDQGANWPDTFSGVAKQNDHWAYQPLRKDLEVAESPLHPIDYFIQKKQAEMGLALSPEADRYTLIRRLSLDLTGLLPTPEEARQFENDNRPDAYERLVDRLLDSPHFGERWGRHWLDMARYADSDGYEKDNPRPDAYRYRDWVIDAINADMPFDRFTIEQLAGDLLPEANGMQRLATAFHRQTLTNTEGGTDQEQFRVEACFDRTETTAAVWLGLTVGCARCHSHKYDAISQREYYQLFAFFNNADETTHSIAKSNDEVQLYQANKRKWDEELKSAQMGLATAQFELAPNLEKWESEAQLEIAKFEKSDFQREVIGDGRMSELDNTKVAFTLQKDGSYLVNGENPERACYTLVGTLVPKEDGASGRSVMDFDTLRIDALSDDSLPKRGPGRVAHGNFVLSEVTFEISEDPDFRSSTPIPFVKATADHAQDDKKYPAQHAIDGDLKTGWAIGPQYGKKHWLEIQMKESLRIAKKTYVRIRLQQQHGQQHTLGRIRVSLQRGTEPTPPYPQEVLAALRLPTEKRKERQKEVLLDHFSLTQPTAKKWLDAIAELKKKEPPKPEIAVRVMQQRLKEMRNTYVLRRGEFLEPIKETLVSADGLGTLPPLVGREGNEPRDRLDLAHWLVSQDNPLTPRVTVNHIWRLLFGYGLVRTPNDFGVRGDRPTHPELLDWLALDFLGRNGVEQATDSTQFTPGKAWSRKSIIKRIVTSATYRQSSRVTGKGRDQDPSNQYLSRQNRLRVEGEIVRDISLQVSGLLSDKVGGPSVYPTLPPGIAELSYAGNFKWSVSEGEDRYRRGMYTFFKRTSPHPNLLTFDCPDANLTCVDRNRSNTPLQALVSLNNDTFAEAAMGLAHRVLRKTPALQSISSDDDRARIDEAFRLCLSRSPSEAERSELETYLKSARQWYSEHAGDADELTGGKNKQADAPVHEFASWVALARILINLDEFITRE